MERYYLAVDIGASSGRHMLAWLEDGKMNLQEVYRFSNGMYDRDGTLCWDMDRLFGEVKNGLKQCAAIGKIPSFMGIDTWGVDFALLDEDGNVVGDTVGYRDSRTEGMDEKVYESISPEELYARTGIQRQLFNTIYQLMALKKDHPDQIDRAKTLLMIPDFLHFRLTGVKKNEYTNATTGQLVNAATNDWDTELMERVGIKKELFLPLSMPGTVVGGFTEEVRKEVGFDCTVVLPATHDTGSAVLAVPSNADDTLYISSGTWSLMGVERKTADCSEQARKANFTNEGGYDHRYRFLKNIMGLWMIQSVKKEMAQELSFAQICEMASKETIDSIVDCNDDRFLAPKSMTEAVKGFCADTGQTVPETTGELAAVIYNSLAKCYADTLAEIESMTGVRYDTIHVVGGGANAAYLNELTAGYTGRTVLAGPTEATAIGNIMVQMMHDGVFENLAKARECVGRSFDIQKYEK